MTERDLSQVHRILNQYARENILLWRDEDDLRQHLENFFVVEMKNGEIAGCVALADYGNGLFEVRSLAVDKQVQGQGIGRRLIQACIDECRKRRGALLFALTLQVDFFRRMGFRICDRGKYPQKVWRDCYVCPRKNDCNETLLEYPLTNH